MITEITERQYEIIEAAGKILTEKGVGGLTIKNLAAEMNFTESAIYRHFKSKEDIIVALLGFLNETMAIRLETEALKNNEPEAKLNAVFKSQFEFFTQNSFFVVAVFSDGLFEESEKINKLIIEIMSTKSKLIKSIINQGQETEVFNGKLSLDELTHIVMGTFRLLMFKWRLSNFSFDLETEGTKYINAVLSLIKKCNEK